MRSRPLFAGLIAMAAVGLAGLGCPKEQPAAPSSSAPATGGGGGNAPAAGGHLKIAVMPKGTAASFWQSVKAGADAAGKEAGAEIIWQGPASEGDITQQIDLVNNQVTSKVDGIVIAATDANALVKPLQEAKAKGIPIVTVDSGVSDPSVAESYIATDNVEGGRRAADALAKLIGEKGNVGLMYFQKGAKSSDDRQQGFEEGIKKYPNIKIVSELEANDPQKCTDAATNMLTGHPDIVGIFAANEPNGIGAGNVLRQKSLVGKVKLVAYDSSPDELTALKDGVIEALIVQDPFQMGYKGVQTVIKAIHKEPITDKFINSGMTVVTKDNLDTPEVKKLLGQ